MTSQKVIGFVGLGAMGNPIAHNILEAGFSLVVYNRTATKVAEWLETLPSELSSRVETAFTPKEAATKSSMLVSMVTNDSALEDATLNENGILEGLSKDGIHVCMSTVSPETSSRLSALHAAKGVHYIACEYAM
jgi:3-hydroxyisobutyrate dehydrogenase-like beta-hydroxyacid dehydrogenase